MPQVTVPIVVSPGPDLAIPVQSHGVVVPGGHLGDPDTFGQSDHLCNVALGCGAVTQLAVVVGTWSVGVATVTSVPPRWGPSFGLVENEPPHLAVRVTFPVTGLEKS